jgi:hypothetical protein
MSYIHYFRYYWSHLLGFDYLFVYLCWIEEVFKLFLRKNLALFPFFLPLIIAFGAFLIGFLVIRSGTFFTLIYFYYRVYNIILFIFILFFLNYS